MRCLNLLQRSSVGVILVLASITFSYSTTAASSIDLQLHSIPERYSRYLDAVWTGSGWESSVPSSAYKEGTKDSTHNLRMQMTFAFAYTDRDDADSRKKVETVLRDVLITRRTKEPNWVRRNGTTLSTRSFHDAIGLYLALRILQSRPDILAPEERAQALANIQEMLPWVLRAPDTENRALLGAGYGVLILRDPLLSFSEEETERYIKLIREKTSVGLRSVDAMGIYREGVPARYSLHYHLVAATMLALVGQELGDTSYTTTAHRMAQYVHNRYPAGKLSWRGSGRPSGIGLQTVLLRTTIERYLGNKTWEQYWLKESAGLGFIDRHNPDRLVWRDDRDFSLNDDYSFVNMAAIAPLLRYVPYK